MLRPIPYRAVALAVGVLAWLQASVAQDRGSLRPLAEKLCSSGSNQTLPAAFVKLLGYSKKNPSALVLREADNTRHLYVMADDCRSGKPVEGDEFHFIFANFTDRKVGIYFIATSHGELTKVFRVVRGPGPVFTMVDAGSQMLAPFDAEKNFWTSKHGSTKR